MADAKIHSRLIELEALRTGEGTPELEAHVQDCSACQRELAGLRLMAVSLQAPDSRAVPHTVDQAMHRQIQARAHAVQRGQRIRRLVLWPARVAAALFLAAGAWWLTQTRAPLPGDVDGNGTVDIVDAYHLAKHIQAARGTSKAWDLDNDGDVDQDDVKAVARRAVAVKSEDV